MATQGTRGGQLACPACQLPGLTEAELHLHYPLYHAAEPTRRGLRCPVCREAADNPDVHIHNSHGPQEDR